MQTAWVVAVSWVRRISHGAALLAFQRIEQAPVHCEWCGVCLQARPRNHRERSFSTPKRVASSTRKKKLFKKWSNVLECSPGRCVPTTTCVSPNVSRGQHGGASVFQRQWGLSHTPLLVRSVQMHFFRGRTNTRNGRTSRIDTNIMTGLLVSRNSIVKAWEIDRVCLSF